MFDPANQTHFEPAALQMQMQMQWQSAKLSADASAPPRHRLTSAELYALQRRFDQFIDKLNAQRRRHSR